MKELVEVTKDKLYVLSYDSVPKDYEEFYELGMQIKEHISKDAQLIFLPAGYNLEEVSDEDLMDMKLTIEEVLKSRQNNS